MGLVTVIALGIGLFLLLKIALSLGEEHGAVKLFLICLILFLALLLPKTAIDNCQVVLDNTSNEYLYTYGDNFTEADGITPNVHWELGDPLQLSPGDKLAYIFHIEENKTYNYKEVCIESTKVTNNTYYKIMLWLSRLVLIYGFVIFFLWVIARFKDLKNA